MSTPLEERMLNTSANLTDGTLQRSHRSSRSSPPTPENAFSMMVSFTTAPARALRVARGVSPRRTGTPVGVRLPCGTPCRISHFRGRLHSVIRSVRNTENFYSWGWRLGCSGDRGVTELPFQCPEYRARVKNRSWWLEKAHHREAEIVAASWEFQSEYRNCAVQVLYSLGSVFLENRLQARTAQ